MTELSETVKKIYYKNSMVKTLFQQNTSKSINLEMLSFLKKLLEPNIAGIKKHSKLSLNMMMPKSKS